MSESQHQFIRRYVVCSDIGSRAVGKEIKPLKVKQKGKLAARSLIFAETVCVILEVAGRVVGYNFFQPKEPEQKDELNNYVATFLSGNKVPKGAES